MLRGCSIHPREDHFNITIKFTKYFSYLWLKAWCLFYNYTVLEAADKAISALRQVRSGSKFTSRKRKVKDEVSFLFNKKRVKGASWKHWFVCLAYRDQSKIPTTDTEKDDLLKAGLGEQIIELDDLDMDANAFREVLLEAYPQLKDARGFMFFKCAANSRALEPLSQVVLSSPRMLKDHVGTARTYIRLVQRDMDLSAVFQLPKGIRN